MPKIRFWKWQPTDELGMPCPTRFPMTDVERNEAGRVDRDASSFETWNLERPRTDSARAAPPK